MPPTSRYFEITQSTPTVKLDTQGRGTVQYKVKNVSAAPIDGRAVSPFRFQSISHLAELCRTTG